MADPNHNTSHTADGKDLPNTYAITMPNIPTRIDYSQRVGVLADLGQAIKNAGGSINVLDRSAGNIDSQLTRRVNDLIIAANAMGATPAMATYLNIDFSSFDSIIQKVAAGMRTVP